MLPTKSMVGKKATQPFKTFTYPDSNDPIILVDDAGPHLCIGILGPLRAQTGHGHKVVVPRKISLPLGHVLRVVDVISCLPLHEAPDITFAHEARRRSARIAIFIVGGTITPTPTPGSCKCLGVSYLGATRCSTAAQVVMGKDGIR